ncbi:hypothetical protein K488DRAFT_88579 [Vararia minispora EC-137]|uniref:Uncharacterized protein n=1 Tax=Vararia minispora EC-137 TaxID=1314806 RepID=A0ACB8QDA2_9AGAM|nr:hypothetical protein K488DRAFT_88579 [Vararia minispora EC-137]
MFQSNAEYQVLSTDPEASGGTGDNTRVEQLGVDDKLPGNQSEERYGDRVAWYAAVVPVSVIAVASCALVLFNNPMHSPWVSAHIFFNPIALILFVLSIITLQPTSQPATKAAGLARHQRGMVPALATVFLGTSSIIAHKLLYGKRHFHSWHGTIGIVVFGWLIAQLALGGASVWFDGAAFGGGMKAKLIWKYHRLSGYLLLPLLLLTIALGGASHWAQDYAPLWFRVLIYSIGSAFSLGGVVARLRPSKIKFF